jgi:hypothetical protein
MDNNQMFVLLGFLIVFSNIAHMRWLRYRLVANLRKEGLSASEIEKIVKAYRSV